MLTAERLRELVDFDPNTGIFTSKVARGSRCMAGKILGGLHRYGYIRISVDGREHKAHRLAWLYVHGQYPVGIVDHINGRRDDNRIANLRDVDHQVNAENRKGARSGKKIPLMGVKKQTLGPTYTASIKVKGKVISLGGFSTPEAAHAAYLQAKAKHHVGAMAAFTEQT